MATFASRMAGRWNTVFKRFARWCKQNVWEDMFKHFSDEPDLPHVLIDSTIVRAHPGAAGARQSTAENEALGRSRGGYTTKIHVLTDALGNPLNFILTGGQDADIGQAEELLRDVATEAVIGDQGYDSDSLVRDLTNRGIEGVIPPRSNRNTPRPCDWFLYKERHLVECFFNKIKPYRRIFSRFEKTARNFNGFLHFVGALIWNR